MTDKKLTDVTDNNVGKMTDNEIVKALEWLESKTKEYCEQCAYKNSEVCDICIFDKIKLALDLINLLQAQKDLFETCCARKDEAIRHLEAENERLFSDNQKYLSVMLWGNKKQAKNLVNNIKTQAYKECIEKVKEHSNKTELVCSGALVRTDYTITKEKLDNLLKELVGEDNA